MSLRRTGSRASIIRVQYKPGQTLETSGFGFANLAVERALETLLTRRTRKEPASASGTGVVDTKQAVGVIAQNTLLLGK